MRPVTRKVAYYYGAWCLLWLLVGALDQPLGWRGELGISAQFYLSATGMPLGLFSWYSHPNGSLPGIALAGLYGLFQWCLVAEINSRINVWLRHRKNRQQSV